MKITASRRIVALVALFICVGQLAFGQVLRLRYAFDESSGNALDSSGFMPLASGALAAGASRTTDTPGSFGLALDLTAQNSYLTTGSDINKIDGPLIGDFTYTTWLNVHGTPNVFGGGNIMGENVPGALQGFVSLAYAQPSSGTVSASNFRFQFLVGDGASPGPDRILSQEVGADQEWVFVAATFDANNFARIYFGGVNAPVTEIGSGAMSQGLPDNGSAFVLGSVIGGTPPPTAMLLDDVRVYSGVADLDFLERVRFSNVPEPSTITLTGFGLLLLGVMHRYRRHKARSGCS